MPLGLLVALFIAVPLAELYLILKVGDAIGWLPTLLILMADSILGSLLLRAQGRAVWRRFQTAMQDGRMPHREAQEGVLIISGGALLITPGFLSDVFGLVLLVPPTRELARRFIMRRLARRAARRVATRAERGVWDVEGTATEAEPPPQRLPR